MTSSPRRTITLVSALGLLYTAQGIPFGFAGEYLPVVLRAEGYKLETIGLLSLLQLPWQLKIFWAHAADSKIARARTTRIVLLLQTCLALTVAMFALRGLHEAPLYWFALTALAAFFAASQDVFVDAFAVRALRPDERGYGNTAQVAGYRIGMLIGGAGLLMFVGRWGEPRTILACAGIIAVGCVGTLLARRTQPSDDLPERDDVERPRSSLRALAKHALRPETRSVFFLALTFKLGIHVASVLLKPMLRDFHWSHERIGSAAVIVGSASALAGAAAGGFLHRTLDDRRALLLSCILHTLACVPLVFVAALRAPYAFSTVAMGIEHFVSGLGTTALFAALMSATRPADAGLHYTTLTSANALGMGIAAWAGGAFADRFGYVSAFVLATGLAAMPVVLLQNWNRSSEASARG